MKTPSAHPLHPLTLLVTLSLSASANPVLATCPASGRIHFDSPQASNAVAVTPDGLRILVCNTDNSTLSVLDAASRALLAEIPVGLEPVSVAVHPGGGTALVANFLSDSLSVVDLALLAPVATITDVVPARDGLGNPNPDAGRSRFDEPAQVVLSADGTRAYVALSGSNEVAIVDTPSRSVTGRLAVDGSRFTTTGSMVLLERPRALALFGGDRYLAVAAFEGGNRTETAFKDRYPGVNGPATPEELRRELRRRDICFPRSEMCAIARQPYGGDTLCGTLCTTPAPKEIVVNAAIPDRDLAIFDLQTGQALHVVGDVGTLNYAVIETSGTTAGPFELAVLHTDARNDRNGLAAIAGRPWLNRLSRIPYQPASGFGSPQHHDLDSASAPDPAAPAAIPRGIAIAPDRATWYVTAAGSARLLAVSPTGSVIERIAVGAVPTAVAVNAVTGEAVVLNRHQPSLSVVELATRRVVASPGFGADPLSPELRLGARAVHDGGLSANGSFACASCHPASGFDQLAWDMGTAGEPTGPRLTQALRGLPGTGKFHWDGRFATLTDLVTTTVGKMGGNIDATRAAHAERWLESLAHLPGSARPVDDRLLGPAREGIAKFFSRRETGIGQSCSNAACHAAPRWTSTGTIAGVETASVRALDRRRNLRDSGISTNLEVLRRLGINTSPATDAIDHRQALRSFLLADFSADAPADASEAFADFFAQTSSGLPGILGRQVTRDAGNGADPMVGEILASLWQEVDRGKVAFTADGLWRPGPSQPFVATRWDWDAAQGVFCSTAGPLTRAELESALDAGDAVATFTARMPARADFRPELHELCADCTTPRVDGSLWLPIGNPSTVRLKGRNLEPDTRLLVEGALPPASPLTDRPRWIDGETLELDVPRFDCCVGDLWVLSLQAREGLLSNDLPVQLDCPRPGDLQLWVEGSEGRAGWDAPIAASGYRLYAVETETEIENAHAPLAPAHQSPSNALSLGPLAGGPDLLYYQLRSLCGNPEAESLPD